MTDGLVAAKARYLGGHPAAVSPIRKTKIVLASDGLSFGADLVVPLRNIFSVEVRGASQPAAPRSYRYSPTAGLFGGIKENRPSTFDVMQGEKDRKLVVAFHDDSGFAHDMVFEKVQMQGRSRAEFGQDMDAGDWNGVGRFSRPVLAARSGA